jgi:phosphohistidine phosphatase
MKRIVTVRHAKAVPYGYDEDFSRDLTDRGENDAAKISNHVKSQRILPDLMISSPANRAWQTAMIFANNLGYPEKDVRKVKQLYMDFTIGEFIDFINGLPDEASTVFIFGHNPGMLYYTGKLAKDFRGEMPTCSTVGIDFEVESWKDIESHSGKVAFHFIPKMF